MWNPCFTPSHGLHWSFRVSLEVGHGTFCHLASYFDRDPICRFLVIFFCWSEDSEALPRNAKRNHLPSSFVLFLFLSVFSCVPVPFDSKTWETQKKHLETLQPFWIPGESHPEIATGFRKILSAASTGPSTPRVAATPGSTFDMRFYKGTSLQSWNTEMIWNSTLVEIEASKLIFARMNQKIEIWSLILIRPRTSQILP